MYALMFMFGVLTTVGSVIAAYVALSIAKQNDIPIKDEGRFIMFASSIMIVTTAMIIAMNEQ